LKYSGGGFDLHESSSFTAQGLPNNPIIFTSVQAVQEQLTDPCPAFFVPDLAPDKTDYPVPLIDLRFCSSFLAAFRCHLWGGDDKYAVGFASNDSLVNWNMRDCSLRGGRITLGEADNGPSSYTGTAGAVSWFNNVLEDVAIDVDPTFYTSPAGYCNLSFQAYNNLFRRAAWFHVHPVGANTWTIKDNVFDEALITQNPDTAIAVGRNAYFPVSHPSLRWHPYGDGRAAQLQPTANELLLSAPLAYQTGPLGRFYLNNATPLYRAGSRTSDAAGLYHYTTSIDQVKEGKDHLVNIGLHYVAVGSDGKLLDSDAGGGDGIPDYVENAAGDGTYHTDTETDWLHNFTATGVEDKASVTYDEVDLDGDGLLGNVENALSKQPLVSDNPLSLILMPPAAQPEISYLKVLLSYDNMTANGELDMLVDGKPAAFQECSSADSGAACVLAWNSTYEPPGTHMLQARFIMSSGVTTGAVFSAVGPPLQAVSDNVVQFSEEYAEYDGYSPVILTAQVPGQSPGAPITYDIQLRDNAGQTILTKHGQTSGDRIIESWDLLYPDGQTRYSGDSFDAVFTTTVPNRAPVTRKQTVSKGSLTVPDGEFTVAFAALVDNIISDVQVEGPEWKVMQYTIVDALMAPRQGVLVYNSSFNAISDGLGGGDPGLLTSHADVANRLLPNLSSSGTRNFYFNGHGSPDKLKDYKKSTDPSAPVLWRRDVAARLQNTRSLFGVSYKTPYRFVFLDACSTAKTRGWQNAFGIRSDITSEAIAAGRRSPQAFVGWDRDHATVSLATWNDYQKTYQRFFTMWMNGNTIEECKQGASTPGPYGADPNPLPKPFPIPQNHAFWVGDDPKAHWFTTSPITIGGYPGTTRTSYVPR